MTIPKITDPMAGFNEQLGSSFAQFRDQKLVTERDAGLYGKTAAESAQDWYKTYPYRFIIKELDTEAQSPMVLIYSLPIPPESLILKPVYPSEAIATMGGVVEETSDVVFWQIAMSGTMPHAISRKNNTEDDPALLFRANVSTTGPLSSIIGGVLKPIENALGKAGNIAGAFSSGFSSNNAASALQAALQPPLPYKASGVVDSEGEATNNGFTEIHKLQKFFLLYQKLSTRFSQSLKNKDLQGKKFALFFENIKDGQSFRIIPKETMFAKTAQSPYTYKYQLSFVAWNLATPNPIDPIDRFGPGGDLATVNTLTVTSLFNGARNAANFIKRGVSDPLGTFVSTPPVL